MLFSLSLAIGRIVSLLVDGPASRLLNVYLGLEIVGAALGVAVLAYTRNAAARR
jgi:predicted nucleic acid-binding protein